MLKEVGFQAGQHEVIAESYKRDISETIKDQIGQIKKARENNIRKATKCTTELRDAKRTMFQARERFRRAYDDQIKAKQNYENAEADGRISRNDVQKLKQTEHQKTATCEQVKHSYADRLVKTNEFTQDYYYSRLPAVLDELQDLEIKRIELINRRHCQSLSSIV